MKKRIYNISSEMSFVDVLASKFLNEYEDKPEALAEVLFLLPNRRAVRAFREAFVRARGMKPTLLPRMIPIGDVEEDELILTGGGAKKQLPGMLPAIGNTERMFLFVRLIMSKPSEFGMEKMSLSQAAYLAQELASMIDLVNNEQLSFANLEKIVPDDYASHWQETLKFLKIITDYWPQILAERGLIDASRRRNILLETQVQIWQESKTDTRIVAAGTTATFPAMKKLVRSVLELPNGEVYLSGLDKVSGEDIWEAIDETHPQFELKDLLDYLKIDRFEVENVGGGRETEVEKWVSEIMRPAEVSDNWLDLKYKNINVAAWSGVNLIRCADIREEALAIALIMRHTLEYEEKTAALVTSDRNLARRVAAELERWNVKVDDSAGKPLLLTPVGIFLRLIVEAVSDQNSKTDLLALLKNPLTVMGMEYSEIRKQTRNLEKKVFRERRKDEQAESFLQKVMEKLKPLREMFEKKKVSFKDMLKAHIALAEELASTPLKSGDQILWRGEDGEAGAKFVADILDKAEVLGEIEATEYLGLLEAMMVSVNVRPKYGAHPRLKILGPIEARLNKFDVTIVGEVNEGVWPKQTAADPWMSRPMKKEFGFPLPEKAIGVMAFDFSQLLAGKEVYLTRAERVQGTPMVKSRWWLRLETVLKALKVEVESVEDLVYKLWAKQFDKPKEFIKIDPPAPTPPIESRPKRLSVSAIEMWMRDPYSIYAKHILKLRPLDDFDHQLNMADYGNIVHGILQEFNDKHNAKLPDNAKDELLEIGKKHFEKDEILAETKAFWWPNFVKSADWILEQEKEYRDGVSLVHNEVEGEMEILTPRGFVVSAIADRIDETKDGKYNIIDYKTGKARSEKEVKAGFAPQLPIEGLIAKNGGFKNLGGKDIGKLIYWRLGKKATEIDGNEEMLENTYERLSKLVNLFEFEKTAYVCQPNPKKVPEYSDYEHLARVKEWSIQEDDGE